MLHHFISNHIISYYIISPSILSNPILLTHLSNNSWITGSCIITPRSEVLLPAVACVSEVDSEMEGSDSKKREKKRMRQTEEEAYGQVEKVRMFEWTDG